MRVAAALLDGRAASLCILFSHVEEDVCGRRYGDEYVNLRDGGCSCKSKCMFICIYVYSIGKYIMCII